MEWSCGVPRSDEISDSSCGDASPSRKREISADRPRLSQQQKDWIRDSIDRLKLPRVVPDAPTIDAG
jgi:hypothetical protein